MASPLRQLQLNSMIATFPKVISRRSGGLGDLIISSLSRCGRSFANVEGRNTALTGQPELALGWMSGPGVVPVGDRRSHSITPICLRLLSTTTVQNGQMVTTATATTSPIGRTNTHDRRGARFSRSASCFSATVCSRAGWRGP